MEELPVLKGNIAGTISGTIAEQIQVGRGSHPSLDCRVVLVEAPSLVPSQKMAGLEREIFDISSVYLRN